MQFMVSAARERAVLGGGCFWCIEAAFQEVVGVYQVTPGYSGGESLRASYNQVCSGTTNHAEVVEILFDPKQISYKELLEIFFALHDPTTVNRQGNDIGSQYRSVIFYTSLQQKQAAQEMISNLSIQGVYQRAIVTEVLPLDQFYPAEAEHHNYYKRHPEQPYCQLVINPKLAKIRAKLSGKNSSEET